MVEWKKTLHRFVWKKERNSLTKKTYVAIMMVKDAYELCGLRTDLIFTVKLKLIVTFPNHGFSRGKYLNWMIPCQLDYIQDSWYDTGVACLEKGRTHTVPFPIAVLEKEFAQNDSDFGWQEEQRGVGNVACSFFFLRQTFDRSSDFGCYGGQRGLGDVASSFVFCGQTFDRAVQSIRNQWFRAFQCGHWTVFAFCSCAVDLQPNYPAMVSFHHPTCLAHRSLRMSLYIAVVFHTIPTIAIDDMYK